MIALRLSGTTRTCTTTIKNRSLFFKCWLKKYPPNSSEAGELYQINAGKNLLAHLTIYHIVKTQDKLKKVAGPRVTWGQPCIICLPGEGDLT
ncbi:hypothetical protein MNBD_NITROSPINAE02-2114 [hydrothermal vent metagenome]|uniref:Uncharacterized protein n=1 Tax=hydrothermal vent metagenome TaxID=652676 RepID=A0A3B1CC26_9ZZZZ